MPGPLDEAKHHRARFGETSLRWEQHSEFTTYSWELPGTEATPFLPPTGALPHGMRGLPQPGPHLVSADLHLMPAAAAPDLGALFDPASLAAALVDNGGAIAATDFRAGADGFVRILVLDRELTPARAGALAQRLLEIETYRTLALLGMPESQRIGPSVRSAEETLVRIAGTMTQTDGLAADHALLDEMTALASRLEAEAASSNYRFGASRAYDNIVQQRLVAIGEQGHGGWPTIAAFLARRMAPAMRTCQMLQERQADLATKLARAANLLRTRVDVALEQQNRDLLAAGCSRRSRGSRSRRSPITSSACSAISPRARRIRAGSGSSPVSQPRCSCRSRCWASGRRCGASAAAMARAERPRRRAQASLKP